MLLSLLLTILKILALILIFFLALVIFVISIILFVPFGYKIRAEKYDTIDGTASFSWLFGVVRVLYEAKDLKGYMRVKLLGFTVWREKKPEEENSAGVKTEEKAAPANTKEKEKPQVQSQERAQENNRHVERPWQEHNKQQSSQESQMHQTKSSPRAKKTKINTKKKRDKKVKADKNSSIETFKRFWNYEDKTEIIKQAALLLKRLIKILISFKAWAELKIGTGQPHTTGFVVALICAMSGYTGAEINAEGDFENKTLTGRASLKGRIFICSIVWVILLFIFNKNIFPIIKKLIFKKG